MLKIQHIPIKYIISDPHNVDTSMNFETTDRDVMIEHIEEKYAANRAAFGDTVVCLVERLDQFVFAYSYHGTIIEVSIRMENT